MNEITAALAAEAVKARRAPVLWLAAAGFSIVPLVGGLFMLILADPERARRMGLLGQKARLTAGTAEWSSLLDLMSQAVAVGGMLLFALVTAWVFGREFSDRTVRTLLAVPTRRVAILAAKGAVVAAWCTAMTGWVVALTLAVGFALGLPGWSPELAGDAIARVLAVAGLTIALQTVTAWAASAGRGFLAPIGLTLLALALANVLAVLGWGALFPWAVPSVLSGAGGEAAGGVGPAGIALVAATSTAGAVGTARWWVRTDHLG
jgi:ABC-2 type transport system permease protein